LFGSGQIAMSLGGYLIRQSKRMSRKGLYEFLGSSLSDIPEGANVLNIGSGGEVEPVVRKACGLRKAAVTSLDISAEREPNIVADICEIEFEEEFDAIVMAEVLEHVQRPHIAVERVLAALKPGGKLILTVPFIFPIHDRPHDYFRYTKYGLQYLLGDYNEVKIQEKNGWGEAIVVSLARFINTSNGHRYMGVVAAGSALLFYPFAAISSRSFVNDFLTTGYFVVARRRA